MENKNKIVIKEYLRERIPAILAILIVNFTYFMVYILYHLPEYAMRYSLLLSCFLLGMVMLVDYHEFKKKHNILLQLNNSIEISEIDKIQPWGSIEQDYQQLVTTLQESLSAVTVQSDEKLTGQMEYLTMWTHQIKTPVAALRLIVASMEPCEEKSNMEQELFRVEEYINMVLLYLRTDSMNTDLLLKEYDLDSMVKKAVKKYSIVFINKHLSLSLDELNCCVTTDEKWLIFVIEQILSNALKYTKQGGIHIYMEDNKKLVIRDSGIGIQAEDIHRIFERGYTGYNGRLDRKSTGIGLYLCKKILDRLGHSIIIESELNQGTKVTINLEEYRLDYRD